MNNLQQTARVGLFFLLGLALTWVTFETLSGGKILKHEGYLIVAGFESLKELKEGDEVRMAGVRIGDVRSARLAGRRAEAILRIAPGVAIKSDAVAMIASAGLIGTNYVTIDLGTGGAPDLVPADRAHSSHSWLERLLPFLQSDPVPLAEIKTASAPDLNSIMKQIGSLGEKLEGSLGSLGKAFAGDDKNPGLLQKIDTLVTENREKVSATVTNLQQVTDKLNKGDGTLGKLINSSQLHDELIAGIGEIKAGAADAKAFIASAQSILNEVKQGKGTLGALVFDQKAGDDIKAAIATIRSVSDKISRGEGTLGKLINDDSLFRDTQTIMKKADRALDGLDDTGPITAVGVVYRGLF